MTREKFELLLKGNNAIRITEKWIVFNDYELYSFDTEISFVNKTLDELLERSIGDITVGELVKNTEEFYQFNNGGRGSKSTSGKMGGGFGSAPGPKGLSKPLLPAELNLKQAKGNSVQKVLKRFNEKYGNADHEYAIAVDEQGYAHKHVEGGKHSVGITGDKGQTLIHNHPSGSNFSDADLLNVASTKAKSIIATSSNANTKGIYTFTKTNKFNAKDFIKAVKKAQWPEEYDYNKGADWWLRKNQKKYGYKYGAVGVKTI